MKKKETRKPGLSMFPGLEPARKIEIGTKKYPSLLTETEEFKSAERAIQYVAEHGVSPFEEAAYIDVEALRDKHPELKAYKQLGFTLLVRLRGLLKRYDTKDKLEVVLRDRGKRIYLAGIE